MKEAIDGEALEFADDDGELGGEVAGEVGRAEEKRGLPGEEVDGNAVEEHN